MCARAPRQRAAFRGSITVRVCPLLTADQQQQGKRSSQGTAGASITGSSPVPPTQDAPAHLAKEHRLAPLTTPVCQQTTPYPSFTGSSFPVHNACCLGAAKAPLPPSLPHYCTPYLPAGTLFVNLIQQNPLLPTLCHLPSLCPTSLLQRRLPRQARHLLALPHGWRDQSTAEVVNPTALSERHRSAPP